MSDALSTMQHIQRHCECLRRIGYHARLKLHNCGRGLDKKTAIILRRHCRKEDLGLLVLDMVFHFKRTITSKKFEKPSVW